MSVFIFVFVFQYKNNFEIIYNQDNRMSICLKLNKLLLKYILNYLFYLQNDNLFPATFPTNYKLKTS